MDEGQVVVLDHDGTNLVGSTTVDTLTGLDDHRAHSLLLKLLEVDGDLALPLDLLFLGELGNDGLFHRVDLGHTGELVGIAQSSGHLVVVSKDAIVHLGNGLVERILLLDDGAVDALILLDKLKLSIAEARASWPNCMAASMSSSVTSSAPASTMEMKSLRVPPSSRSRSEFSRSS